MLDTALPAPLAHALPFNLAVHQNHPGSSWMEETVVAFGLGGEAGFTGAAGLAPGAAGLPPQPVKTRMTHPTNSARVLKNRREDFQNNKTTTPEDVYF